jgi:5'-nucleotidase
VAVSFAGRHLETLLTYGDLLTDLVGRITRIPEIPVDTILNVNLPDVAASEVRGVRVTKLGNRFFSGSLTRMNDPWGREVFWIGGGEITWTGDAESDHQAVADGFISITPLHMDLTSYSVFDKVRGWALEG